MKTKNKIENENENKVKFIIDYSILVSIKYLQRYNPA